MKTRKILSLFMIVLFSVFAFTGCVSGVADETTYQEYFSGITAYYAEYDSKYYSTATMLDEEMFNDVITDLAYTKIEMNIKKTITISGLAFMIKANEECDLSLILVKNNEEITTTKQTSLNAEISTDITFFLDQDLTLTTSDEFAIVINQEKENDEDLDVKFKFDCLLIILSEVI